MEKVLIIGNEDRYLKYMPDDLEITNKVELIFVDRGSTPEQILEKGRDATYVANDAMGVFPSEVINNMPNLKIIHSEGVGYNFIDLQAAKEKGVYVCNSKGMNDKAVAEQAIMLMIGCLRNVINYDQDVREGHQITTKERAMAEGILELGDCKIGLIGFGDIAKEVARKLIPFDTEVYYTDLYRASKEIEEKYHVTYLSQEELIQTCDFISLHVPVTPSTKKMVNQELIQKMKDHSYIINTARGDLVDNDALLEAINNGKLAGAGLDTVDPEPVPGDLPLLKSDRIIFSPHIAGITTSSFKRSHYLIWESFEDVNKGKRPKYIVNGL